ncbi:MAG: sigma-70 family RNA polymerase sigma factor [Gemmataceae bacterium]|nr:sigma-70 family RNA polymerase sigma factor [Gemmataceae bacterium]
MNEITRLLSAAGQGDPHAAGRLLPLVYDELRVLAAQKLAHEKPGQTLQPTALVHEAYLRLVGASPEGQEADRWDGRGHFFAAAAESMRRILVENARRKKRIKHGGDRARVALDTSDCPAKPESEEDEILALDEALKRLEGEDPEAARLVQLHYFGGLPIEEAAQALGMSRATAYRQWTFARAWLRCAMDGESAPEDETR